MIYGAGKSTPLIGYPIIHTPATCPYTLHGILI